nr:immunoglobulin heavy chain junction region [Macaca mulatta]MOW45626.1 immunoglobulin heavy chain junction region [Macaca mulatta]MOW45741.1 immunoglobulin heavy chain junction region [Macaca mulatta]MOW46250.1 immunoglobulin heavy chain junction region [Macaca mulatta]MOW46745.1 immunoglobulin heavy chain junction region [Macaca mulatta]
CARYGIASGTLDVW